MWETFTISEPMAVRDFDIIAVSGPTFDNFPNYPALRVVDFQVVGELPDSGPGFFNVRRYEGSVGRGKDLLGFLCNRHARCNMSQAALSRIKWVWHAFVR